MQRWHAELPLMIRRQRFDATVRTAFGPRPLGAQRKRHPLDCGHPRCALCHSFKYDAAGPRRQNKRQKAIAFELSASG